MTTLMCGHTIVCVTNICHHLKIYGCRADTYELVGFFFSMQLYLHNYLNYITKSMNRF